MSDMDNRNGPMKLDDCNAKSNEGVDGVVVDIEISELLTGKTVSRLLLKVENAAVLFTIYIIMKSLVLQRKLKP